MRHVAWLSLGLLICLGLTCTPPLTAFSDIEALPSPSRAALQPSSSVSTFFASVPLESTNDPISLADFTPPEIAGQIGGGAYAVVADRELPGRTYLGVGPRVRALDLGVAEDPVLLGESPILPSVVEDLHAAGGMVYATLPAGLAVIDFREPERPIVTDFLRTQDWTAEWGYHFGDWRKPIVHLGEGRLLLAREPYGSTLELYDLSDPARPELQSTLLIGANHAGLSSIASQGERVAVAFQGDDHAGQLGGLAFFDLSRAEDARSGRIPAQRVQRLAHGIDHVAIHGDELVLGDGRCDLRVATGGWDRPLTTQICQDLPGHARLHQVGDRLLTFVDRAGELIETVWWYDWSERSAIHLAGFHEIWAYDLQPAGDGRTWYAAQSSAGLEILRFENGLRLVEHGRLSIPTGEGRSQTQLLRMGSRLLAVLPDGLHLLDLADPHRPRPVDRLEVPDVGKIVAMSDDRLLAIRGMEILVVAIDPDGRLERLGRWEAPDRILDLAVEGDRAAVLWETTVQRHHLSILDLSDANAPREVGQKRTSATHETVLLQDGKAFLSGWDYLEIFAIDTAEGVDPVLLGRHHIPELSDGCQLLHAGHAYCGRRYGLDVIDLRDPEAPRLVSSIDQVAGWRFHCPLPRRAGDMLHCPRSSSVGDAAGSWRLDIEDPGRPRLVDRIVGNAAVWDLTEAGGRLHLLTTDRDERLPGSFELLTLEISGRGRTEPLARHEPLGYPEDIVIQGDRAYVTLAEGIAALDIRDPGQVRPIWRLPIHRGADRLRLSGDRLYVTTPWLPYRDEDESVTPIHVYDLSDHDRPQLLATIAHERLVLDLAPDDEHRLYLAEAEGLVVLDVRDPQAPVELGRLPSRAATEGRPGGITQLALDGDRAYLVDAVSFRWGDSDDHGEPDRLRVVDIADPTTPTELGHVDLADRGGWSGIRDLVVAGDRLWLAMQTYDPDSALWVIDVSRPESPRLETTWAPDFDDPMPAIVRDGRFALLAGWSGVWAIDVEASGGPQLVTHVPMPNSAMYSSSAALAADGTLWFANGNAGLVASRIDFAGLPTVTPGPSPTRRPLPTAAPTSTPFGTGTAGPSSTPTGHRALLPWTAR